MFDVHVLTGRGGEWLAAVTTPSHQRTNPVPITAREIACLGRMLERIAGKPKRRSVWPVVGRILARDGIVTSRTLAAELGDSASSAGWYLGQVARQGKLRREGKGYVRTEVNHG